MVILHGSGHASALPTAASERPDKYGVFAGLLDGETENAPITSMSPVTSTVKASPSEMEFLMIIILPNCV